MKRHVILLLLAWGLSVCLPPATFAQRGRTVGRPGNTFARPVNTFVHPAPRTYSNGFRNPYLYHELHHYGNYYGYISPYYYGGYYPYLGPYNFPSYGTYPYYSFPSVYGGANPGISVSSLYGNYYSPSVPYTSSYAGGYPYSAPASTYGGYPSYAYSYPTSYASPYNYPSNYGNDSMLVQNFYKSPAGSIDPIGGEPTPVTTILPPAHADSAVVIVKVPSVDAEVWFDGKKTNNTGVVHVFQTPELPPAKDFTYTVRAEWMRDSLPVSQERTVTVRAGKRVVVDFMK